MFNHIWVKQYIGAGRGETQLKTNSKLCIKISQIFLGNIDSDKNVQVCSKIIIASCYQLGIPFLFQTWIFCSKRN